MTSENSPTVESEALLTKVGALEKQIVAAKTAIRRGSRIRLTLLFLLVALIAGSIWMFYNLAMEFASQENLDRLTAKATERANQSSEPALKEVQALVEHCQPVLTKAFTDQVEKDTAKYTEVLTKERELLVANLEKRLHERIMARYEEAGKQYQEILKEEFPDMDDPDTAVQLYASISQILEKLVQSYYTDQMDSQVKKLGETWEKFDMAEVPGEGEPGLERELLASLLQVAADKFATDSDL